MVKQRLTIYMSKALNDDLRHFSFKYTYYINTMLKT